jgi:hypothetical protein
MPNGTFARYACPCLRSQRRRRHGNRLGWSVALKDLKPESEVAHSVLREADALYNRLLQAEVVVRTALGLILALGSKNEFDPEHAARYEINDLA